MAVSRRVGQVTFSVSVRTSCRNLNGEVFAIGVHFDCPHTNAPGRHPTLFREGGQPGLVVRQRSLRTSVRDARTARRPPRVGAEMQARAVVWPLNALAGPAGT